jgi:hypothetical protein
MDVTFADNLLHLVRVGARIDNLAPPEPADSKPARTTAAAEASAGGAARAVASVAPSQALDDLTREELETAGKHGPVLGYEPGMGDLEAAVALVSGGLAKRVVLSGFQSWPGLLWRAYKLAEEAGVLILPTVVRPGGRVDIVVTRDIAPNG